MPCGVGGVSLPHLALHRISTTTEASAADCCNACNGNPACVAYTWDTQSHQCFLKDNLAGNHTQPDRVSGTNGRPPAPRAGWRACTGNFSHFPFCDTSLPLEARVNDLVGRIPLDQIGAQLTARQSPAMPELGLPAY